MTSRTLAALFAVATAFSAAACSHDNNRVSKADVQRENAEAKATAQAYVEQKIEDIQAAVRTKVERIDAKIAKLRAVKSNESDTVKDKVNATIAQLEAKKASIQDRSKELERIGKSEGGDVRNEWIRLDKELDDVTAGLDDLQSHADSKL